MQKRSVAAMQTNDESSTSHSTSIALFLRDMASGCIATARQFIFIIGFVALASVGALLIKPQLGEKLLSHFQGSQPEMPTQALPGLANVLIPTAHASIRTVDMPVTPSEEIKEQQRRVTEWISRRYRVATDASHLFVSTAYQTAKELKLDPLLILSVIAIESRFNPFAESPAGAQGLMQVMTKVHEDKFAHLGGPAAALHPIANIQVGSRILKNYVARGGSVEAGLKMYVGAALLKTDFGYGAKVLAEHSRLKNVAMGDKVSIHTPTAQQKKAAPQRIVKAPDNSPEPALAQNEQPASAL